MNLLEAILAELARTPEQRLDNVVRLRKVLYDTWWECEEHLNPLPDEPMFSLVSKLREKQADAAGSYLWPGSA